MEEPGYQVNNNDLIHDGGTEYQVNNNICFMMEKLQYQVNNNDLFYDGGTGVPSEQ
jgi:hypothetical protein